MQSEIKEALDNLTQGVEDHRSATDQRLGTFESQAAEDRTQRAEFQEQLDRIETAFNRSPSGDDSDPDERKAAERFAGLLKAENVNQAYDTDSFADYQKAMGKYLRGGMDTLLEGEKQCLLAGKALAVGVEADGGYWVQPAIEDRLVRRLFETSPMRSIAGLTTISTDALEMIQDVNSAVTGGWVGEKDTRAETATPEVDKKRIAVHEQFANPRVTQKLLDDSAFDVERWLAEKIADIMTRTENTTFVSGVGTDRPRGFLDYSGAAVTTDDATRAWGVLQYVATGASAGFDTSTVDATASPADELIDLVAKLNPAYRSDAVWAMNRATEAEVRKLRDSQGNYVIDRNTGSIGQAPFGFTLLGFPIVNFEDMPDIAADTFSIAFGNFREGYRIVERQGTRVLRDPFTAKPFVQFYTTKRVGGDVVNFDAIKLLKFGTS